MKFASDGWRVHNNPCGSSQLPFMCKSTCESDTFGVMILIKESCPHFKNSFICLNRSRLTSVIPDFINSDYKIFQ